MCGSEHLRGRPARHRLATVLLTSTLALGAWAQSAPSREQEQVRRLRLQVQQLQQDLTSQQQAAQRAQAEKAALQQQLEVSESALRKERSAVAAQAQAATQARKSLDEARAAQDTLNASLAARQSELQAGSRSLAQLQEAQAGLRLQLTRRETELRELSTRHATQAEGLQRCIDSNLALRDLGRELLDLYARQTVADVLARDEPFLQYRRVALENLVQGYGDKLDAQAVKPAAGATRTPPAQASRAP